MNTIPFFVSKASDQPEVSSSIPSIHSGSIKFLVRIIDGSISDRNSSAKLTDKFLARLSVIDKSHFTCTQKLWILQHLLIPRNQGLIGTERICLHSKVVTSPSLNIKSLFLFFSISLSIANKEHIISSKSFKN